MLLRFMAVTSAGASSATSATGSSAASSSGFFFFFFFFLRFGSNYARRGDVRKEGASRKPSRFKRLSLMGVNPVILEGRRRALPLDFPAGPPFLIWWIEAPRPSQISSS